MTEKTDRDRALERIVKCMKLSKSSEPHESAAALRQAQKLMQQFSIDENELHGIEVKSVLLLTPEPPKSRFPMYLCALVSLVSRAFDAQPIFETGYTPTGQLRQGVRYFVAGGRAPLVEYAHQVIWRQLTQAWADYRKTNILDTAPGERSSFWMGWIGAVGEKVMAFGADPKEKEVVEQAMRAKYPGVFADDAPKTKVQDVNFDSRAIRAGKSAAADFSIHTPMAGSKQGLLN